MVEEDEVALGDLGGELAGEAEVADASAFFVSKKAAAVLKHGILKRYIPPWAAKVGSTSRDKQVAFVDGFAGAGRYKDGTSGSPDLVLDSARNIQSFRNLQCHFVERRSNEFAQLAKVVEEGQSDGLECHAYRGTLKQHLSDLFAATEGIPAFFFIDPFGLGLNFDELRHVLSIARPSSGPSTELMVNFSANAVRRIGGLLQSPMTDQRIKTLAALDDVCGGAWWRQIFIEHERNEVRVQLIADEWAKRLAQANTTSFWCVPVRNRASLQPVYHLAFFTRHPDGMWLFGDSLAGAQKDWRRHLAPPPRADDGVLFALPDAFETEEEAREAMWLETIKRNVLQALTSTPELSLKRNMTSVVRGDVAGLVSRPQIRKAVKELNAAGLINCPGVGKVEDFIIRRP